MIETLTLSLSKGRGVDGAPDIAAGRGAGKEDIKKYAYRYLPH